MHGTKTGVGPVVILASVVLAGVVRADVVQDCRQEATTYGIVPELVADYVQGCIQSRGGYAQEPVPQDAVVQDGTAADNDGMPVPETAGTDMTRSDHSGVEESTDGAQ